MIEGPHLTETLQPDQSKPNSMHKWYIFSKNSWKKWVLRKLRPRKHRPQTRGTSDPEKLRPLGGHYRVDMSRKLMPRSSEKLTPLGCLENTDPQFNIFQISTLLGTFNFQIPIYQSAKRGVAFTWAMSRYSLYHWNEQTSRLFSNIDRIRDDITERFRLTMTLPLPVGKDFAFYNRREFFCLLDC